MTTRLSASTTQMVQIPEESRELPDVTIRVRETSPGFFETRFEPTSPTHLARGELHGRTRRPALDDEYVVEVGEVACREVEYLLLGLRRARAGSC